MGSLSQAGKLLLGVLLVAAPSALAHGGFDAGAPLGEGSIHVRILGAPVLAAGVPLRLEIATDVALPIEARLVRPPEPPGAWFGVPDEGAVRTKDITFAAEGTWRVDVRAGADVASFEVTVWRAGGRFVEPASDAIERGVVVLGGEEALRFRVLDAAHRPLAPPSDAIALVSGPDGTLRVPLGVREGALELRHEWSTRGEHTIEVLSDEARLTPGARPSFGLLVVAPEEAPVYGIPTREVPVGALSLLALLIAAALVRVTRGPP